MVFAISVAVAIAIAVAVAVAVARIVLADADRRHDALTFADIDDAHAARGTAGDTDAVDRTADQRAAVGDQHDLIALQHGERRPDGAPPLAAAAEALRPAPFAG